MMWGNKAAGLLHLSHFLKLKNASPASSVLVFGECKTPALHVKENHEVITTNDVSALAN
jgi:hypothetical protein